MKRVILRQMILRNFKGIKEYTFEPNGANAWIRGDNATGKTTLADAWHWLWTGRDTLGQTELGIKTLDATGAVIHHQEHSVEVDLLIDGQPLNLRRVWKEEWTRPRSSFDPVLSSHTTEYFINAVPFTKGDWLKDLGGRLGAESILRMCVDPAYFPSLSDDARRSVLLELCGTFAPSDVIATDPELKPLVAALDNHTPEERDKMNERQLKEVRKKRDEIPGRIQENRRQLKDEITDVTTTHAALAGLRAQRAEAQAELQTLRSGGGAATLETKVAELRTAQAERRTAVLGDIESLIAAKRRELNGSADTVRATTEMIRQEQTQLDRLREDAERLRTQRQSKGERFTELQESVFTPPSDEVCPTCARPLPEESIAAASTAAESAFNLAKSTELEQLRAEAANIKTALAELSSRGTVCAAKLAGLQETLEAQQATCALLEDELKVLVNGKPDFAADAEYRRLSAEIVECQRQIQQIANDATAAITAKQGEIRGLDAVIAEHESLVAQAAEQVKFRQRIAELEEEQVNLSDQLQQCERVRDLLELYARRRAALIDSRINGKFRYVQFKLFETQINGGIREVCEILVGGVPYSGGLNQAARVRAALDITEGLQKHYGLQMPVFVDGAESVTRFDPADGQRFYLAVTPGVSPLRVDLETDGQQYIC